MQKILEALTNDSDGKICNITEGKDIRTIPLQELICSLKAEKELIAYKKATRKNKKSLALVAAKAEKLIEMNEGEEDGDDELVMLAKNFKRFLKNKGNRGKHPQKFRDCPRLKKKSQPKKAMKATWDDDLTEEDLDSKVEEIANAICLMENDSMNVTFDSDCSSSSEYLSNNELECECKNHSMTYTELNEANDRLLNDYTKLMDKCKELSLNNKRMITRISELENDITVLKIQVDLKKGVDLEKVELKQLLEKAKNENLELNSKLNTFELRTSKLDEILEYQSQNMNKKGLGYGGDNSYVLNRISTSSINFVRQNLSNTSNHASTSSNNVSHSTSKKKNIWMIDNGCSRHMTGDVMPLYS
ncbi:hypothetical protein LIER_14143 [Lithospermum erythrorhizon]|uniref:Uncharacterized protein n=1 Tax=Lithospermum erythrorhizon TaxID=34254 RepID=A0AAV3Q0A7_LITER